MHDGKGKTDDSEEHYGDDDVDDDNNLPVNEIFFQV